MVKLFMTLLVVDVYLDVGLVWLCGRSIVRPLQASDLVPCISMEPCRGGLPSYMTPKFWGQVPPGSTEGTFSPALGFSHFPLGRLEFCDHALLFL